MALIETARIKSGMILAQDVTNLDGRVLLREGVALSTRHVTALKAWGVERVRVIDTEPHDGGESTGPGATSPRAIEIDQELSDIFRHTDRDHPVIAILYRAAKSRRLGGAT